MQAARLEQALRSRQGMAFGLEVYGRGEAHAESGFEVFIYECGYMYVCCLYGVHMCVDHMLDSQKGTCSCGCFCHP